MGVQHPEAKESFVSMVMLEGCRSWESLRPAFTESNIINSTHGADSDTTRLEGEKLSSEHGHSEMA